jgi:glutamate synthase domain-containing protein 2
MLSTIFNLRFALITWPAILIVAAAVLMTIFPGQTWWLLPAAALCLASVLTGLRDLRQTRHAVLRNYPVAAHLRFLLEAIRPEMRQYFFEGDKDGAPFPRDKRAIVYQRAKKELDKRPFGTQYDVYQEQYEWLHHSIAPRQPLPHEALRTMVGEGTTHPCSVSLLNISAMSYGSLSANAIRALNKGAKVGGFYHDTGEGGVSPYHRENGGDLVWELGSGYFGARRPDGGFDPDKFAAAAADPQIRMVELKLSQGAKPGHGGVLPAAKVTEEISRIRGVPIGQDCNSPASHSCFSTPTELLEFIARMRELSGGKPAGFKLCIGHQWEFMAICKAMLATGITPDFIVVDGKEGGTGAAPLEFMDYVGMPLRDGLSFVHNALVGIGVRDRVKIGASGKITSAFDMARVLALGADWCNAARGFMFAVGCIQV